MLTIENLKEGMQLVLRDDLEPVKKYGKESYVLGMGTSDGTVLVESIKPDGTFYVEENEYTYTLEMISGIKTKRKLNLRVGRKYKVRTDLEVNKKYGEVSFVEGMKDIPVVTLTNYTPDDDAWDVEETMFGYSPEMLECEYIEKEEVKETNYFRQIEKMLGLEYDEVFQVSKSDFYYKFSDTGMMCNEEENRAWPGFYEYDVCCNELLLDILQNKSVIKYLSKFPEDGSFYFFIDVEGDVCKNCFIKSSITDVLFFKIGNYFLTREEITEDDIDKYKALFNDPEKVEVTSYEY